MKKWFQTAAAVLLGAVLCSAGAAVTAHADGTAVLGTDGTLTLSGNVVREDVTAFGGDEAVRAIVCAPGTVLPEDCSDLFRSMWAETIDLSNADTSNVTNMHGMFASCPKLDDPDLSSFDTSAVTDMNGMFYDCPSLISLDLSSFDGSSAEDISFMFYCSGSLQNLNLNGFVTSVAQNMEHMFMNCYSLTSLDLSSFDTSNVTNMTEMFTDCDSLTSLNLSSFDTSNVTSMLRMFTGCSNLSALDLSSFRTPNLTDMREMFAWCSALETMDLHRFDTSAVENMCNLFCGCHSLESVNLTGLDTSAVRDMTGMFAGCDELTVLDVSSFDTSNVAQMNNMFEWCKKLGSLDVSNFNTSNVTEMGAMFGGCESLVSLDLRNFDTSRVGIMGEMFRGCISLQSLNVTSFDTSSVITCNDMFRNCEALTQLDLSSFDISRGWIVGGMFNNCTHLETVWVTEKWGIPEQEYTYDTSFENCYKLVGGNGTSCPADGNLSLEMARIDRPGTPGYFTEKVYSPVDNVTLSKTVFPYTGKAVKVGSYIKVKSGSKALKYGTDYTMTYAENTAAGYQTASVTVTGIGDYRGTVTKYYSIVPQQQAAPQLSVNGSALRVAWTKDSLANGYQVQYCQNASFSGDTLHSSAFSAGKTACDLSKYCKIGETWFVKVRAFVSSDGTVSGSRAGLWSDAVSLKLIGTVDSAELSKTSFTYKGSEVRVGSYIKVRSAGNPLKYGTDFTLTYADNVNAGTASVTVTGIGNYTGTVVKEYTILPKTVSASMITLSQTSFVCTGKAVKVGSYIRVKNGDTALRYGTDFTLTYADNISTGTASVTVTGIGNYAGSAAKYYMITPVQQAKPQLSTKNGSLHAEWTADTNAQGYQVQYCQDPAFTGNTLHSSSFAAKTAYDFTAYPQTGETWYVRVRAYVKNDAGTKYGIWSDASCITIGTVDNVTLTQTVFAYTGKAVKVGNYIRVKSGTTALKYGTDFTLTYADNVGKGTATVTVTGIGEYAGTIIKEYTIR